LQADVKVFPGAPLSVRERRTVWFLAQGLTYTSAARRMGLHPATVKAAGGRVLVKLEAANMVQAVFIATSAGIIGRYIDCGTRAAYLRHLARKEITCHACRMANAEHARAQRAGELRKKES
jgi:DNA-binding CsgD family transcriptional regulator